MSFLGGDNPSNRGVKQDFPSRGTINAEELQVNGEDIGAAAQQVTTVTVTNSDIGGPGDYTIGADFDLTFYKSGNLVTLVLPGFVATATAGASGTIQIVTIIPESLRPRSVTYSAIGKVDNNGSNEDSSFVIDQAGNIFMTRFNDASGQTVTNGFASTLNDVVDFTLGSALDMVCTYVIA